jgi:hypothetical protein
MLDLRFSQYYLWGYDTMQSGRSSHILEEHTGSIFSSALEYGPFQGLILPPRFSMGSFLCINLNEVFILQVALLAFSFLLVDKLLLDYTVSDSITWYLSLPCLQGLINFLHP